MKNKQKQTVISETVRHLFGTTWHYYNLKMEICKDRIIQLHKKDFIKIEKVEVAMSLSIFILAFKGQSRRKEWRKYVGCLPWFLWVIFVCIGKQSKNWNCIANLAKIKWKNKFHTSFVFLGAKIIARILSILIQNNIKSNDATKQDLLIPF